MSDQTQGKTYDLDSIPTDATPWSNKTKVYDPLEDGATFQVEVKEIVLKDNIFYKPVGKDGKPEGSKYTFGFTLVILDEGEFRGRRIWDNAAPVMKPEGKKGASKLFKLVTKTMNTTFDWETCASFAPETPDGMKILYKNLMENVLGGQLKVTVESTVDGEGKNKVKVAAYSVAKAKLPTYVSEKEADQKSLEETAAKINNAGRPTPAPAPAAPAKSVDDEDWMKEASEALGQK